MTEPTTGKEVSTLLAFLNNQREHVLGILEGLSDEALRRAVLPSGWSCLGLVQHLALDVERFWFRAVIAGESVDLPSGAAGWQVSAELPARDVLELYRHEIELANAVIASAPLDNDVAWWPANLFGDLPRRDVRETVTAVIVETACHAGHLDAVRELLDGTRWLVLTE